MVTSQLGIRPPTQKPFAIAVAFTLLAVPAAATAQTAISFIQPLGTPVVSTGAGNGPIGLASSDFDGDGKIDLAVTVADNLGQGQGQQGFVMVMRGNGDGTFAAPSTLYTAPSNVFARGILAKDFDADGKLDLAVAVGESTRQILFFKGTGTPGTITFNAPVLTSTNHRPQGLQTADLNGDGKPDLVTLNSEDNTVSVLLGVGDGTFQQAVDYAAGSNPLDIAIGNVDGMNGPDLVVGSYETATVNVLLNSGNGTFGGSTPFNARLKPQGLYLADFDGDGVLDVIAAGNDCNPAPAPIAINGCMAFMKGQGNGGFAVPADENLTGLDSVPIRRFTENVAPDLNGDGKPDVLFVPLRDGGQGRSVVAEGLGTGAGTFNVSYWVAGPPQPAADANPDFVAGLAAVPADFDRDGVLDLAYAAVGKDPVTRGGVSILLGDTPGTFMAPRSYSTFAKNFGDDGQSNLRGGAFGDFTGDGKVDLAVMAAGGCPDNGPLVAVFPGSGDGSLGGPIAALALNHNCEGGDNTLRSADLDHDGNLDLVVIKGNAPNGAFGQIASGNGNGTFGLGSTFGGSAGSLLNLVLADFDGDSYPDVAAFESVGCFFPNAQTNIEIFLQGAGGTKTFTSRSILPVNGICGGGTALAAADFDKDGKVDLVVPFGNNTDGTNASALFFKGKGDGTFENSTIVGTGLFTINDYAAADLNEDGNLDLIGRGTNSAIYVQLGNGSGAFQTPVAYGAGGNCDHCVVQVADFDADVHLDLATVGRDSFAGFAMLRGRGDGTFESPVKFAVGATGTGWLDIADMDGDGQPDVVIGHGGQNGDNYTVLVNNTRVPAALMSIAVTPANPSVPVGSTQQFTAIGTYSDGSTQTITGSVTWASTNAAVATISASGLASAVASGTTTISAQQGGVMNTTTLRVVALQSVTLTPQAPSIIVGATVQFAATGHYSDGTTRDLTSVAVWTSSKISIATITAGGLATGIGKGTSTIRAAVGGLSTTTTLTVNALVLQSITVAPATATISVLGGTQQFTATGHYSDGTTQSLSTVSWSSSAKMVASVSSTGLARAVKRGTTTITAKSGKVAGSATLTVQ